MADNLLIAGAPDFRHLDQLVPPVFRSFCNRNRPLCKKDFDNQIDRLLRLKGSLADLRLGHAALIIDTVIKEDIDRQQGFHQHPMTLCVGVIESKLLIPEFAV